MPDATEKVKCVSCGRSAPLDANGFLKPHRTRPGGGSCSGSGRHVDFNGPKES